MSYYSGFNGILSCGNAVPEGATKVTDFAEQCGINYTVEKAPKLTATTAAGVEVDSKTSRALVTSDGVFLATVSGSDKSKGYRVVNHLPTPGEEIYGFQLTDMLAEQGAVKYVEAGRLKDGGMAFVVCEIEGADIVRLGGKIDPVTHRGIFCVSYTGRHGNLGVLSTHRLHCTNELPGLSANGLAFSIPHRGNIALAYQEAQMNLLGWRQEASVQTRQIQTLADDPMNVRQFRTFATDLLNDESVQGRINKADKDAAEKFEKRESLIEELTGYFTGGIGNTGESAWDGMNSITEWLDHKRARMARAKDPLEVSPAMTFGALFGKSNRIKEIAAHRLITR